MSYYTHDFSLFDSSFPDLYIDSIEQKNLGTQSESVASTSRTEGMIGTTKRRTSPPRHRHDGTSPLPLGMDWSIPPTLWDGRDSIWPHDPHTGWSYCVTIPSWTMLPRSSGSGAVVFYRVQVGVQSPEGITTITGTLRRFSDFLKLFSEVKKLFPWKKLPSAPPRRLLMRTKSRTLMDERRCLLEDWMEKLLSDIDVSRSAPVANFLELEVAARSCFNDSSMSDERPSSDMSLFAGASSVASDYGEDSVYEISEIGTPKHGEYSVSELSRENSFSKLGFNGSPEAILSRSNSLPMRNFMEAIRSFSRDKMLSRGADRTANNDKFNQGTSRLASYGENGRESLSEEENNKGRTAHNRKLSSDSGGSDASSARFSEISNLGTTSAFADIGFNFPERSDASSHTNLNPPVEFPSDSGVVLPTELRRKFSTVLVTLQRRLAIAKTDMEDLVSRFQQETAARQYLVMKVKDLETELEIARETNKESLKNAVSSERERYTQMQWDMEELRKRCLESELRLKNEQDEKARIESAKLSVIQENEMLLQELDDAREQLDNMQKHHEESDMKSKTDVKLLVKEVKSLRQSQTELKQELSRLMKEKLEADKILEREKQRLELISTTNAKLLYECDILRDRLQECSVSFNVEEEDRLVMDTSSLSDAVDLLTTSDNRIGLLLAEAQLLAQDVETLSTAAASDTNHGGVKVTDNEMRKMLTDAFVDNATLRKQINSLIRCALRTSDADKFERDVDDPDPH
ncbi:PX domain-containing protein [Drosera capensis]